MNKLNQVAQEKLLEEEKSHACSREEAIIERAANQSEMSELQARVEALEANLGKGNLLVKELSIQKSQK